MHSEGRKDYITSAVINIIALYVFQKLPEWDLVFLTDGYAELQSTLVTAVMIGVVGNIVLVVLPTPLMHYLLHSIFSFVTAYVIYRLYAVFPFHFTPFGVDFLDTVVKVFLCVSLVVTLIGLISTLFRLQLVFRKYR